MHMNESVINCNNVFVLVIIAKFVLNYNYVVILCHEFQIVFAYN